MKTNRTLVLAALAGAALLAGCTKSDPVATTDNQIQVFAQPVNIPLDANGEGHSTITAEVVDKNGAPSEGIAITFVSDGGTMASRGQKRKTNSDGRVQDTLSVTNDESGNTIKIQALSGKQKAEVDVTVAGADAAPQAQMTISPLPDAHTNTPVSFDGSRSRDDVRIVRYRWTILSTNPDPSIPPELAGKCTRPIQPSQEICDFVETGGPGSAQSIFTRTFARAQQVTVQLDVFDTAGQIDSTVLVSPLNIESNFAPTANAGADFVTTLNTGFFVSAATSSDPDGSIKRYDWDFADGTLILNQVLPQTSHQYQSYAVCGNPPSPTAGCAYDIKLTVYDNGDPTDPNYSCTNNVCTGALTAQDSVKATVF